MSMFFPVHQSLMPGVGETAFATLIGAEERDR